MEEEILELLDGIKSEFIQIDTLENDSLISFFTKDYPTICTEYLFRYCKEVKEKSPLSEQIQIFKKFEEKSFNIFGSGFKFISSKSSQKHKEIKEFMRDEQGDPTLTFFGEMMNDRWIEFNKRDAKVRIFEMLGATHLLLSEQMNIPHFPKKTTGKIHTPEKELRMLVYEIERNDFDSYANNFVSFYKSIHNLKGKTLAQIGTALIEANIIDENKVKNKTQYFKSLTFFFDIKFETQKDSNSGLKGFTNYYDNSLREIKDEYYKEILDTIKRKSFF